MAGKSRGKSHEWLEAKRRCRLSDEDIRMAKELGFKPRGLIKNIPSRSQPWKAPVRDWIRDLHAKRFGRGRGRETRSPAAAKSRNNPASAQPPNTPDAGIPAGDRAEPEELVPQYDTTTEEPYFVRESDGRIFTLEEAASNRFTGP